MIITHETTIEQYEAWLATNPSMTAFKVAVRGVFKIVYRTLGRIGRLINRITRKRSCTAGKLVQRSVYPLSYDKNGMFTPKVYDKWMRSVHHELRMTTAYLEALELANCYEDAVAMEELKIEALEIIHNR